MPSVEILADLLHDVLEALLRDAGHRRDRLVGALFAGSTKCGMISCSRADARLGDEIAQRARAAQPPQPRAARCRDDQLRHCMASKIPSKLGSRASAVTASPASRAAAVVDGPIV